MGRWWPTALERRIAVRYLRGQRGTRSASLQTLIAIGGFATGVTALIIVLGVMNGLSTDLRDKILIASPHLRVLDSAPGAPRLERWEEQLEKIRATPGVVAAAPEVSAQTMVGSSITEMGAQVLGLEPGVGTSEVTGLDSLLGGPPRFSVSDPILDGGVLLGFRLAQKLGVGVGDRILVWPPTIVNQMRSGQTPGRAWEVEVTGIFRTGMVVYDDQTLIMTRALAQEFTGLGTGVTDIGVRVADPARVQVVADSIRGRLEPLAYRTESWQEANGGLFKAMRLEKLAMGLVIFIIMVVAAFNIVGMLTMVVVFKTREIGILLAMGMRRESLRRIFIAQGAIIGLLGAAIGVVVGVGISLFIDRSGVITIDPEIYFLDKLPVRTQLLDVLVVAAASVIASVLATLHPSRVASRLAPVEAIRAE